MRNPVALTVVFWVRSGNTCVLHGVLYGSCMWPINCHARLLYACAWLKSWFDTVHYMWICVSPHHNKRKKTRNTGTRSLIMVKWPWLPNCVRQRWAWNFACLLLGIDIDRLDWMGFGWQILLNGLQWMRLCFCWTLRWTLLIGFGCVPWRT
jgi:hypothetical protein